MFATNAYEDEKLALKQNYNAKVSVRTFIIQEG